MNLIMVTKLSVVLFIVLVMKEANCLRFMPLETDQPSDSVKLEVLEETNDGNAGFRAGHVFPDKMAVRVTRDNKQIHLNLTRNSRIKHDIPISVERNGRVRYQYVEQTEMVSFYQDQASCSSFLVTKATQIPATNQNNSYKFVGTFQYENDTFMVQPSTISGHSHDLTPLPSYTLHFDDTNTVSVTHANHDDDVVNNVTRDRRYIKEQYEVELLAVVDYSIYQFWFKHSNARSLIEKDKEAKNNIRHFYALVINSVDLRYQTIDNMDYEIRVLMTGIHVADRRSASPWTENNRIEVDGDKIDADETIDDFRKWWRIQGPAIQKHDHAMLFTKLNLTRQNTDKRSNNIQGLASVEALCTRYRHSVVQDDYWGSAPITAAHELGHSLGAQHDDNINNTCRGSDGYIMAASQTSLERQSEFIRKQWRFSECSKEYFRTYINKLNRLGQNCMITRSSFDIIDRVDHDLPGQIYDADTQCQNAVGEKSYLSRTFYENDFSEVCTKMPCVIPTDYEYIYYKIALEGTTCGPKKVCQFGRCVKSDDTRIPEDGDCLYGDVSGQLSKNQETCEEEIGLNPDKSYKCYDRSTRKECCRTCQQHAETFGRGSGCKYGNRGVGCQKNQCSLYPLLGYSSNDCCYTCSRSQTALSTRYPIKTQASTTTIKSDLIIRTEPRPPYLLETPAVGSCIRSCEGIADGDYQSCKGCDVYATCLRQTLYDERPCPPSLVWTDDLRRCDWASNTCSAE